MSASLLQKSLEAISLFLGLSTQQRPQTRFCEARNSIVIVGYTEGSSANLFVEIQES
jgi:hypothetical protein